MQPETIDSPPQQAEGASWAGNLAKAVAGRTGETEAPHDSNVGTWTGPGDDDARPVWVSQARERLYPAGEHRVREWLRQIHFACELWKQVVLNTDRQAALPQSAGGYPEDLPPPALAGAGSHTELVLRLIEEGFGPLRSLAELAPEELFALLLLLDDARDCERGVRLAQGRLSEREAARSRSALEHLASAREGRSAED